MCGLIGWFGLRRPGIESAIQSGVHRLTHRGPDASGFTSIELQGHPDYRLVLAHTRLKILDLSDAASQPMTDTDTGNVVVYNGEIYNYTEIRADLEQEGIKCNSSGDTEVLLKAYGRWGLEVLNRLVGMFAFAIWDQNRQCCVIARDHLGIKPLYVARCTDGLLFGSEVRALLATDLVPRRLDPVGLDSYLTYGAVQGPATLVPGIESLSPASYIVVEPEVLEIKPIRYWRPPFEVGQGLTQDRRETVAALRQVLLRSVSEHLISDVPVGAFLSGGVDSSSLVILMRDAAVGPVHTFSVNFAEGEYSEHEYSRLVARRYSHSHTEINLSADDCLDLLPEALAAQDQPTIDGVNVFVISRAVRSKGITVVLSGQGGDELFGGYPTFPRMNAVARHRWVWNRLSQRTRDAVADVCRRARRRWLVGDKIAEILSSDGDLLHIYLILRELFDRKTRGRLLRQLECASLPANGLPRQTYLELRAAADGLDPVNQISLFELSTYLGNMLLRDGDFMSMANSLEMRVPYLDRRVVAFVAALPGSMKLSRNPTKALLVEAMAGALPRAIYERSKQGFTFPWNLWLRDRLRATVGQALDSREAGTAIGFRIGAVQEIWRGFLRAAPGVSWSRVWALYVVTDWCRRMGITA